MANSPSRTLSETTRFLLGMDVLPDGYASLAGFGEDERSYESSNLFLRSPSELCGDSSPNPRLMPQFSGQVSTPLATLPQLPTSIPEQNYAPVALPQFLHLQDPPTPKEVVVSHGVCNALPVHLPPQLPPQNRAASSQACSKVLQPAAPTVDDEDVEGEDEDDDEEDDEKANRRYPAKIFRHAQEAKLSWITDPKQLQTLHNSIVRKDKSRHNQFHLLRVFEIKDMETYFNTTDKKLLLKKSRSFSRSCRNWGIYVTPRSKNQRYYVYSDLLGPLATEKQAEEYCKTQYRPVDKHKAELQLLQETVEKQGRELNLHKRVLADLAARPATRAKLIQAPPPTCTITASSPSPVGQTLEKTKPEAEPLTVTLRSRVAPPPGASMELAAPSRSRTW